MMTMSPKFAIWSSSTWPLLKSSDITGIAVNIAARVEQAAADGEIWVSSTVRDILLGGDQQFDDAGEHTLKGIDGTWRLYRLT